MTNPAKTVTRRELYDLVWTIPGSTLAQRFGVSDVALAKVCKKHAIPRPPRGYWARLQHGQKPRREPLPKGKHGADHQIVFAVRSAQVGGSGLSTKAEPRPFEFFDEGLRGLSERVDRGDLVSPVKDSLRGCHEVVSRTRRWLIASRRRPRWDDYGARQTPRVNDDDRLAHVTISVGKEHEPRALRILDAVIRTLESTGVTVEQPDRRDHRREVLFAHGHWRFELRIRERHKRVRRVLTPEEVAKKRDGLYWGRTYETAPTGSLILEARRAESAVNDCLFEIEDGAVRKLEDLVGAFAQRVLRAADERLRRQAEERERQLLAIERHKKEQAEAERRRVERARADAEMERRSRLVLLVDWRENALRIERFLDEFEASLGAPGSAPEAPGIAPEVRAGLERWVAWGRRVARDTDPMRWKPTSLIEHTHAESTAATG